MTYTHYTLVLHAGTMEGTLKHTVLGLRQQSPVVNPTRSLRVVGPLPSVAPVITLHAFVPTENNTADSMSWVSLCQVTRPPALGLTWPL